MYSTIHHSTIYHSTTLPSTIHHLPSTIYHPPSTTLPSTINHPPLYHPPSTILPSTIYHSIPYLCRVLYAHRYIQYVITALKGYDGSIPLQHYLKQFFAADKKYGSKDRKHISQLCYCYFRLGHTLTKLPIEERLQVAVFLCNDQAAWNSLFPEDWLPHYTAQSGKAEEHNNEETRDSNSPNKKIAFIQSRYPDFSLQQLFPWFHACSTALDTDAFSRSLLVQPNVFIRIRPGFEKKVREVLEKNEITCSEPYKGAIALLPNTKIDTLLQLNKEVVIQDLSSQKTGVMLDRLKKAAKNQSLRVWDCCAASGGKSILATDILGKIDLTVSDVRASIIHNLKQRFQEAGIKHFRSFVTDLTQSTDTRPSKQDLVICDAPCSGSGTWGRTPEQLYFFKEEKITHYVNLQTKISDAAVKQLNPGGYLFYITCSVFKQENEMQVQRLINAHNLELIEQQLITGYNEKADTMFAALLKNIS